MNNENLVKSVTIHYIGDPNEERLNFSTLGNFLTSCRYAHMEAGDEGRKKVVYETKFERYILDILQVCEYGIVVEPVSEQPRLIRRFVGALKVGLIPV